MRKWLGGVVAFFVFGMAAVAADRTGDWYGALATPGATLHVVVHLQRTADGQTSGAFDSLDQGVKGLPLADIVATDTDFRFSLPGVGGRYQAHWDDASQGWMGQWSQSGATLVLNLGRTPAVGPKRPQVPPKPYPYVEKDVVFSDAAAQLAGTLTMPAGKGPFPAAVLISGSGPNDRNEQILNHPVFLVLADYLTRHGVAVLRYDKRGIGASHGDYALATTQDFADDAAAAVAFLQRQPGIDARRVGVIGHSEGGLIAPMVAAHDPSVSFVVMLAGFGVPGGQLLRLQMHQLKAAEGVVGAQLQQSDAQAETLISMAETATDLAAAKRDAPPKLIAQGMPAALANQYAAMMFTPWFQAMVRIDPAVALRRVRCPVLALNGTKDLQVSAAQNVPAIRAALKDNPHAEVRELPGLNHLFQTANTGSPTEFGTIEETFAPTALQAVGDWIEKTVQK